MAAKASAARSGLRAKAATGTRESASASSLLWRRHLPWLLAIAVFCVVLFRSAWLCDDAFITFRTADNFVHGYGLRWNVDERVQSYTHPLWLLLFAAVYQFTREPYYTGIFLSLAVSMAAVVLFAWKTARSGAGAAWGVLILTFSMAFVDYSTSGLENPLTHLLLALFLWLYFSTGDTKPFVLSLVAALAAVNRMDAILLFAPALAYVLWQRRTWRCFWTLAAGMLPLLLWLGFSTLYYGFPFPNTAYAKLNNGIAAGPLALQGCYYLWNSLRFDPLTLTAIVGVACYVVGQHWYRSRTASPLPLGEGQGVRADGEQAQTPSGQTAGWPETCVVLGIALYLLYVVKIGGDFMSGRFLTAPLFAAVCLLGGFRWGTVKAWAPAAAAIVAMGFLSPRPLALSGSELNVDWREGWRQIVAEHGISDERAYFYHGTGLLRALKEPGIDFPDFAWAANGKKLRAIMAARDLKVVMRSESMGFLAYYAGPSVYIVDFLGLTDPLLARLPPNPDPFWRMGHFWRAPPDGYLATLRSGKNMLRAPGVAEYYDHLALITQGRLWDRRRLGAIWNMNLGRYDKLLESIRRDIRTTPPPVLRLVFDQGKAIEELNQAVARRPEDPSVYRNRGALYAQFGDLANAIQDFSRVIQMKPDDASAYTYRGVLYAKQGRLEAARQDFGRTIELRPYNTSAYTARGLTYTQQGEPEKAIEDFTRAIDLDPGANDAHTHRGTAYEELRDWQHALADFQELISLEPLAPLGYYLVASVLSASGNLEAIYNFGPEPPDDVTLAMSHLAWVRATHPDAACRNGAEAVCYAEVAVKITARKTPQLIDTLAAAYAAAGRFLEAVTSAQEALDLALTQGQESLAQRIRSRLRQYEAGRPYHVSHVSSPTPSAVSE